MHRLLIAIFFLILSGCEFVDAIKHEEGKSIGVSLSNQRYGSISEERIIQSAPIWLNKRRIYNPDNDLCATVSCNLVSAKLVGSQIYMGVKYDTVDLLAMSGIDALDGDFLFDDAYSVKSDSLILIYAETNGADTLLYTSVYIVIHDSAQVNKVSSFFENTKVSIN